MLLIFEQRMHFFQHKIIMLTTLNSLFILMAVQVNPGATLVLLYIITGPICRRLEKEFEAEIQKAFEEDASLDYYRPTKVGT